MSDFHDDLSDAHAAGFDSHAHEPFDAGVHGSGLSGWDLVLPTDPGLHSEGSSLFDTTGDSQPSTASEIGNPAEYATDWFNQDVDGVCAPSAITQVIDAQTGLHLMDWSVAQAQAAQLGLPTDGLGIEQAQQLLASFDIPCSVESAPDAQTALAQLEQYLANGDNIVLAVDANPLWNQADPDPAPNHAVVVSAINTVTGQVTLSDTGTPNGNEETVSLHQFLQAWSASGEDNPPYSMLVTDNPDNGADAQAAANVVADVQQGIHDGTMSAPYPSAPSSEPLVNPFTTSDPSSGSAPFGAPADPAAPASPASNSEFTPSPAVVHEASAAIEHRLVHDVEHAPISVLLPIVLVAGAAVGSSAHASRRGPVTGRPVPAPRPAI